MKRLFKMWWMVAICAIITITMVHTSFAASGTLSGPKTIRSGDTIKITATVDVPGAAGLECTVNYDSSVLTMVSVQAVMPGWMAEVNGNTIVAYDNELTNPTTGSSQVLTLEFDVKEGVATGTAVNVFLTGLVLSDGTTETALPDITYTNTIAKPLSKNNKLSNLTIAEGSLSPEFKTSITSYNAGEVDYSVTALTIEAITEDANAKVSIKGNDLKVGSNLITITVTSESGAQRVYTISVKRKQDPDYVAGADASLKNIKLSTGILSPEFSSSITDYVVYLPYEVTSITATGTARDSKAMGVTNGSLDKLIVGDNKMTVVCKAEDGTEKVYTIKVVRMPEYDSTADTPADTPEVETTTTNDETTEEVTTTIKDNTNDKADKQDNSSKDEDGGSLIWYILCIVLGIGAGFGLCYLVIVRRLQFVEVYEEYEEDADGETEANANANEVSEEKVDGEAEVKDNEAKDNEANETKEASE